MREDFVGVEAVTVFEGGRSCGERGCLCSGEADAVMKTTFILVLRHGVAELCCLC